MNQTLRIYALADDLGEAIAEQPSATSRLILAAEATRRLRDRALTVGETPSEQSCSRLWRLLVEASR